MNLSPEVNAHTLCRQVVEDQWGDDQPISPASVAMEMISRFRESDPTVAYHCFLDFKAIARGFLRRTFRDQEERMEQQAMFGELLQARYPARRQDDDVYARPDDLTDAEVIENIHRLKKEARAKDDHAVALLGYLNQRRRKAA